ncbi:TadE/TadG family type IV pilus assembly protein [Hasllibacter sp. MH4015]|uniref:TadE/TadG family type IV pilus assembly protein n=1 Tax=Hasllibacter sp. MH4015 TaxID=2854029 RepID=UPI001CD48B05|nr:TadE/TadG family type IV pilus assembly protein [Hasllibacter sp. MH4015]
MTGLLAKMATSASAMAARLSPRRFARREDGTVTAFAVMMFILMVSVSGIAIDVMRYETQRAQLQYTLDRAILAAASLTQPYDPEGVVRDYFAISGLTEYRLDIRVEEGLNFRRVHAYAETELRPHFMQLFGVRMMTSPAIGAAEERMDYIEVSMVLDISGSMGDNNRMVNLQPAAREFVTEVLTANGTDAEENLVSVSIVPYNGRVNAGALIGSVFTFDDVHNYSNCARFLPADYLTTAIDPAVPIRRLAHWDRDNEDDDQLFETPHCQTDQYGAILPWQHDETTLHNAINALSTGGWTAIDVGMRWGVALLDPAALPAVNGLIASGDVHPDFAQRPAPYRDGIESTRRDDETIKVVVLMTDGDNTNQYDLRDAYRTGYAPIFYHPGDDQYSVWWEDQGQFWLPADDPRDASGSWQNSPHGGWSAYGMTSAEFTTDGPNAYDGGSHTGEVLLWADLWAAYTAEYIAEEWLEEPARASGHWAFHNAVADDASYRYAARTEADTNLYNICDQARAAGIIVFSIAFEAPEGGQDVLEYCATTESHYYDVDGLEINQAFASIARTINQLRLIH